MKLPEGWASLQIGEVVEINPKHPTNADRDQLVSFVPMPAVDESSGTITSPGVRPLRDVWAGYTHFRDGDVIFARITPCMENGKAAVVSGMMNSMACGSTEFFVLRPNESVLAQYLWRFLRQPSFRSEAERHMNGAVGQKRVPRKYIERFAIPVPPLAEQHRIVAKLDSLAAQLARARAELECIPAMSRKLRNGLFDGAVTGKLLPLDRPRSLWSEKDRQAISSRRSQYLSNRRGSRLRAGLNEEIRYLEGERDGWLDCCLADVISLRVGHAFKSSQFAEAGIPLLRGANVAPGQLDWSDTVRLPSHLAADYSDYVLSENDIVLAMDRPMISTGLKVAKLGPTDAGCLLVQRVANPRPSRWILNDYLIVVLQSHLLVRQINEHATGSDLPHISGNDILTTPCPLPPLNEQQAIVDIIKAKLARIDDLRVETARASALVDRLESAVLAKAFRGQLVPQDPNLEPASALLQRIRIRQPAMAKPKERHRTTV